MATSEVKSIPLVTKRTPGLPVLSRLGALLLLISVGPLFFLLNGGYSIQGIGWICEHTGTYGQLFWALANKVTVPVPGFEAQSAFLWGLVLGITVLEFSILRPKNLRPDLLGGVASAFDFGTTAIGLGFLAFAQNRGLLTILWWAIAVIVSVPLTFGFEWILAKVFRGR
jgi:hypothetical protein